MGRMCPRPTMQHLKICRYPTRTASLRKSRNSTVSEEASSWLTNLNMPQMGYDMQEGTLVRWLKSVGDEVSLGEAVAEIETDKAVVEFESTAEGDPPGTARRRRHDGGGRGVDSHGRRGGRDACGRRRRLRRGDRGRARLRRKSRPSRKQKKHPKPRRTRMRRLRYRFRRRRARCERHPLLESWRRSAGSI